MKHFLRLILACLLVIPAHAQVQTPITLPAQSSTYTGNVRGYWFTAPTCFTITGVQVPTDASTGNQSIAIVRFWNNAQPPLYSATTNNFTVLFLTQNNSNSGIIPVNIQVEQGDVIGVLGQRSTVNSYGAANYVSSINGFPVTLARMGMQFPLTTTAPQQLWTEASGSISRVNLYYDPQITYNATATVLNATDAQFANGADSTFTSVWNYGDGSPLDTVWTPTHTYALAGTYNVCSYITNSCGTDTVCTTVTVCGAGPTAAYTSSVNGATVAFTDNSTQAVGWSWDFGDGSPLDNSQNPTHTYAANGTYTVCMIAVDACGGDDTICSTVTVCVPPVAAYTVSNQNFGTVDFSDASSGATGWSWDFGDSSPVDNSQNPTHTYTMSGTYTVCLVSDNGCATDTMCSAVTVCLPASSSWSVSSQVFGSVDFADASAESNSWSWDFGDGSPLDNSQNPSHVYSASGTYTVCLVAANACSSDTFCSTITICLPVAAGYTITANGGQVLFADASTEATSWRWDFGDGSPLDNTQNPSHTYAANGTYTVCMVASNACSADTVCDVVSICMNAVAGYSVGTVSGGTVPFTDASANATSWSWDFGDGSPLDNTQDLSHTYTVNGTYTVCLVATNACSSDTFCSTINVCPVTLTASFSTAVSGGMVNFVSTSAGATGYFWDFGDNSTAYAQNPSHTYAGNGQYTVCLTTWDPCGDTITSCQVVNIEVGINEQGADAQVLLFPNPFSSTASLDVNSSVYSGSFNFELYDVSGALISVQQGQFNQRMTIDGTNLSNGVYFYRIVIDSNTVENGKMIISK
jgi:PKD repeat protein